MRGFTCYTMIQANDLYIKKMFSSHAEIILSILYNFGLGLKFLEILITQFLQFCFVLSCLALPFFSFSFLFLLLFFFYFLFSFHCYLLNTASQYQWWWESQQVGFLLCGEENTITWEFPVLCQLLLWPLILFPWFQVLEPLPPHSLSPLLVMFTSDGYLS